MMRDQVMRAQRGLEEALREVLATREEVNRRKQHGEVLLARLGFLQVVSREKTRLSVELSFSAV